MATRQEIIGQLDLPALIQELIPSCRPAGSEYSGLCPFHDDTTASLSVNPVTGVFKCHACTAKGSIFDLFGKIHNLDFKGSITALTEMAGLAPGKGSGGTVKPKEVDRHDYLDADGNLLYQRVRFEPGDNGRSKKYMPFDPATGQWKRPGEPLIYNLPEVITAATAFICEGERKADVLKSWGFTGSCFDSGADSIITPAMIEVLTGKDLIILPDNDEPGRKYRDKIVTAMQGMAASIKVVDLPGLDVKGDIVDWIKTPGNDKERLIDLVQQTPEWKPKVKPVFDLSRLTLGSDISAGDYTVTFIVDKLIPEQSISLFYAKGGSGKSTVATQIVAAVVSGTPFMGLVTLKRPVVVIDYENPLAVLRKRVLAVEGAGNVYFWTGSENPPQLNKQDWLELKDLITTLDKPLIVIDTLSSACSGLDILNNGDYSPVMQKIVELRNMGATIVLLHHTPKQDETKYIGASCIYNQVDHVLAMYPIKSAGDEKEVTDEDEAKVYRLGTKDKTRFEHFAMHIEFDEDKGAFVIAADPDKDILDRLQKLISEQRDINQSGIINQIGAVASKDKLKRLLKHNEGRLWTVKKGEHNAKIYSPISVIQFSSPIGANNWITENPLADDREKQTFDNNGQSPISIELAGYSDDSQQHGKQGENALVPDFDF